MIARNKLIDLSIVIPIHNEQENLPMLQERLLQTFGSAGIRYEIVLVNDGSKDSSLTLIKQYTSENPEIFKYVDLSRNFGHQVAIFAGMEHSSGGAIAFMDGDLQDPPELILDMYAKMKEGYEVVYAVRRSREGVGAFKKLAYRTFYRLLDKITDIKIPLDTGDFRVIDHKIAMILSDMPEREKFHRGQIAWIGFNQTSVEYDRPARYKGEESYTFGKLLKLAVDGITSFSNFPLRLATYLGFGFSLVASILMIYTLYSKYLLANETPRGWASIMMVSLFTGGVQLICIGIIGEYMIRISNNVKQRPIYLVKDTNVTI